MVGSKCLPAHLGCSRSIHLYTADFSQCWLSNWKGQHLFSSSDTSVCGQPGLHSDVYTTLDSRQAEQGLEREGGPWRELERVPTTLFSFRERRGRAGWLPGSHLSQSHRWTWLDSVPPEAQPRATILWHLPANGHQTYLWYWAVNVRFSLVKAGSSHCRMFLKLTEFILTFLGGGIIPRAEKKTRGRGKD